jgi:glutamyl-tRNA synthetase
MRLEDLDAPRFVPGAAEGCLEDLTWLGLDWDGPAVVQSSGLAAITDAATRLVEVGLAYPCICTRGDIRAAQGAPHEGDVELRYPGTCRGKYASVEDAESRTGRPAGLRFSVPEGDVTFVDGIAGACAVDVQRTVGDFVVARKEGAPSYQLAVVVDDATQGVTEIVRGSDLLPSAARQLLVRRALGYPEPAVFHVPLVRDDAGRRLAKRTDVSWVAASVGLDVPARVTARDAAPGFVMDRVPRHDVTFGARELASLLEAR